MKSHQLHAILLAARKEGLNNSTLDVLNLICQPDPVKIGELAAYLEVSSSAATGLADRLRDLGFATRRHDELDRRVIWVEITAKGRKAMKQLLTAAAKATPKEPATVG